ncbi:MAG: hypothetical protein ACTHN7_00705 [Solirubrobacterales bacterium]
MKYLRAFALAALAAAMMALAYTSTASATVIDGSGGVLKPGTESTAESEGKVVFDAPFGNIECKETVAGTTTNEGSSTETVKGTYSEMSFTSCNSGNTVKTLHPGSAEVHTAGIESNNDGILTTTGVEVEVVHLGVQCIYSTNQTEIGLVTGSATTGGDSEIDIKATIPRTGGSGGAFCGSSAPMTGKVIVTSPSTANIT